MAPAPKKRGSKKKGRNWTLFALCLPAGLMALPTTLVLGAGMIPTLVAWATDRDPDKTAAMTVGGLNFCGVVPYCIDLWKHHHTIGAATKMLSDPLTWLVMYGAAAVGWAFYFGIPPAVASMEMMRAETRMEEMRQKKAELVREWGPEVSEQGGPKKDSDEDEDD
jgi:hypothetical protein